MPNTTNYSFPTPADTDLVKNGADAIRDLGDAVDTAMNTALGTKKSGLVLLNTTSFSAVASQSINDVFSSTYDSYKILINAVGSTDLTLNLRFRVSGSDNSNSSYDYQTVAVASTTLTGSRATSQTSAYIFVLRTSANELELVVVDPNKVAQTSWHTLGYDADDGALLRTHAGRFNATTSFTGFTLINTGTMTGSVSVYGYNK